MPLTYPPSTSIEVIERFAVPQPGKVTITRDWIGKYNLIYCAPEYPEEPSARILELLPDLTDIADAEIVIRNYGQNWAYDSGYDPLYPSGPRRSLIIHPVDGVCIEINSNLGPYIPPGGIMELKRLGKTLTWSAYGYISQFADNG